MTWLLKTVWTWLAAGLRLLGFGFGVSSSSWTPPVGDTRHHLWAEVEKRRGERKTATRPIPRRHAGLRRLMVLAAGLVAALGLTTIALAYLTASTTSGSNGKSLAGSVGAPSSPTVPAYSNDGHVTVSWGAATLASGGAVQGYYVVRSDSTAVCGSLASPVTGLSCSDVVGTNGTYTYTVAAVYGQWTTTATSGPVLVDTVAPAPTVTAPAAGATSVSVTPTITGTAGTRPADSSHSADNGTVTVALYLGTNTTVAPVQTFSGVAVVSGAWTVNVSTALSGGTQYTVKVTQGDAAGNSGSSTSSFTTTAVSSKLRITSTAQTFTAGAASGTITVERDDASNNPVTVGTTTVDLTTSSAAGLFRNTADSATITSVTITAGTSSASFRYRDTTAGSPTITTADHAGVLTSGTQSETVNPSTASKLAFTVSPGSTSADNALTPQPQVTVQDTYGNTVTTNSSSVTIAIKAGTGTSGATIGSCAANPKSAASGVATFSGCQITKTGTGYVLHATDGTLTAADGTAFNITAGAAAKVAITPTPASVTASATAGVKLAFQLQDQFGNNATSSGTTSLTLTSPSSGGFFSATSGGSGTLGGSGTATFANGIGTATVYYGDETASASTTLTAKNGASSWGTTTVAITPGAANAAQSTLAPVSSSITANGTATQVLTVQAKDAFGNNLTTGGSTVTITKQSGTGTIGTVTNVGNGTYTATVTAPTATGSGVFISTLGGTAVKSGTASQTQATVTYAPGTATHLAFNVQPTSTVSGAAISPSVTVRVLDANNNVVTTDSSTQVTLAIGTNPGSGTLSGTLQQTAASGTATFAGLSIDKTGTGYTLAASDTTGTGGIHPITGATSSAFNITPGTATHLAFNVQPANAVAGVAISPSVTVQVLDASNNVVTTDSSTKVTLAIGTNPGSGTLSGTLQQTAASGTATFAGLSINKTGTGYTLAASDTTGTGGIHPLTGGTSSTFTITPGAATKLVYTQQPTTADAGEAIAPPLTVAVEDANGNVVTTDNATKVTLAIGTNPNTGTLTGGGQATVVSGVATFAAVSINNVGTGYTLTATDTTGAGGGHPYTAATSAAFDIASSLAGIDWADAVLSGGGTFGCDDDHLDGDHVHGDRRRQQGDVHCERPPGRLRRCRLEQLHRGDGHDRSDDHRLRLELAGERDDPERRLHVCGDVHHEALRR